LAWGADFPSPSKFRYKLNCGNIPEFEGEIA
jgi:hypothetical protein